MTARSRLTLAIAIPPTVFAVVELFGWYVAAHGCPGTKQPWSLSAARAMVIVASLVAILASVPGLLSSARTARHPEAAADPERTRYLSMFALLVSATLTLGLLWSGLPALILDHCGDIR
jgi:hypothetical protein